jgi:AbrB family looped-hinge helix DNA binding protein
MATASRVKVSSRYQISLPSAARQQLEIEAGDHLLVDVQDGVIVLIPQPDDYVTHMAGLHREIWNGINSDDYLSEERDAWRDSSRG